MASERRAFERRIINRALQLDLVLFGSVADGKIAFLWRSTRTQLVPDFRTRELAIDWMAERLAEAEGTDLDR